MTVATYEDVAVAIGRPISEPAEQAQVEYWLSLAEVIIEARLGDLSLLDQTRLRFVETEAVAAKLTNPGGYQYEAIDDYRYGLPTESRRITILDSWWAMLGQSDGPRAYSVIPS